MTHPQTLSSRNSSMDSLAQYTSPKLSTDSRDIACLDSAWSRNKVLQGLRHLSPSPKLSRLHHLDFQLIALPQTSTVRRIPRRVDHKQHVNPFQIRNFSSQPSRSSPRCFSPDFSLICTCEISHIFAPLLSPFPSETAFHPTPSQS